MSLLKISISFILKVIDKFVEIKNKQELLMAKATLFAQEGPELENRNTVTQLDACWHSSPISSAGIH